MQSSTKLGGTAAILLAIGYIAFVIMNLLAPQGESSVQNHVDAPVLFVTMHYVLAVGAVLGIAIIPAVNGLVTDSRNEALRWSSLLAIIGFAITALNNFRQADIDTRLADVYAQSSAGIREVIEVTWVGLVELSPNGALEFGGPGVWILTVSWLMLKSPSLPRWVGCVGIACGTAYLVMILGVMLGVKAMTMAGMVAGGVILAPVWYIWAGARLLRS